MTPLPQQQQSTVVPSVGPVEEEQESAGDSTTENADTMDVTDDTCSDGMIGKTVDTPYGVGTIVQYRSTTDNMYAIELKGGATLYTDNSYCVQGLSTNTEQSDTKQQQGLGMERQTPAPSLPNPIPEQQKQQSEHQDDSKQQPKEPQQPPKLKEQQPEAAEQPEKTAVSAAVQHSSETSDHTNQPVVVKSTTMELNVAYQALEKMRILNLEMQCFEKGIVVQDKEELQQCSACLLSHQLQQERFPRLQKFMDETKSAENTRFPRIQKQFWGNRDAPKEKTVVLPRIQRLMDKRQRARANPCLICAAPSCPAHSSPAFRKENITLCHSCERFFELDFISDCISNPDGAERAKHVDRMIDLYDRSLLLLRYSSQYMEKVALALEENKEKQNKIGLGSSSAGIVSGALGIAAAATILTPAGPPLLIASLLFGGSATAVQTGTDAALNYFSEPTKLADRIIALHGISKSLLRVTSTLRDAIARHGRIVEDKDGNNKSIQERVQENYAKSKPGLVAASTVGGSVTLGSAAGTAAEVSAMGGARSATALSRAGTAAARTVRFARFAGGALSAAVLVMEANAIQSTVTQIRAGNPCEKADTLRKILEELDEFPSTDTLDGECRAYLQTLERPVTLVKEEEELCEAGATILEGECPDAMDEAAVAASLQKSFMKSSTASGGRSLIERIQMHKDRQLSTVGKDDDDAPILQDLRELNLDLIS